MARFTQTVDILTLSDLERSKLQPGQWVTAGPEGGKGQFWGQGRSTVVAWLGNAKASGSYRQYQAALRTYGKNISQKMK